MDPKEAISECVKRPELLRELEPMLFEQVVAELLAGFGWEVSVTPMTRDGGYDILGIATDRSGLQTSWAVECKRYSAGNKIGVEVTRQLVGVKHHLGIPNAVLVTTSGFTAGALEVSAARQDLQLVDFDRLTTWLGNYVPPPESTHTSANRFSSCFVSHSSKDKEFTERLSGRLRQAGVRIWYAPDDIRPGDKIYDQVKMAITTFDRLLVVLSNHSMKSNWVQTELASAIARERNEKTRVLFPLSLVPIAKLRNWEYVDADLGIDIARELRSYYISDFSDWKNPKAFEREVRRVVEALRESGPPGTASPSEVHFEILSALAEIIEDDSPFDAPDERVIADRLGMRMPSVVVRLSELHSAGYVDRAGTSLGVSHWSLTNLGNRALDERWRSDHD